ncbi:hypothetical protein BGX38DRAFT_1143475 [Terfezia claveryi]|nr:hypothetical protein BGX38DRAFT_1143475 [Terfezia claveryi]
MDISGLLTEDLPTRPYRTPPMSTPCKVAQFQQLSPIDEAKETLFHCNSHARIPLRLALRPTLTAVNVDIMVRTFFGLHPNDTISYMKGDQSFATVGLEECMRSPEFTVVVTNLRPDLRCQQHPFASSQTNAPHPSRHISGYGLPSRPPMMSQHARSISPSSGRGRRSGSASATNSGSSRSMKRQISGHSHPPVEELVDEYLYQQHPHLLQFSQTDGKGNRLEPVASADISLDNIVEGSRRKRAKFSSAELPLFSKPIHPASYSPTRPVNNVQTTTPSHSSQYGYYQQHTPNSVSPYSYGYSHPPPSFYSSRPSGPNFPTPAPTIATDISDEDVALQLMRLGEVSTSNSPSQNDETADDAGSCSEDQGDEVRSDTTELPELPPPVEEYEELNYPRNQKKYKSLNEILPSYDSTIPSDNEENQCKAPETVQKEQYHYPKDEEDDGDYVDEEQSPLSCMNYGPHKLAPEGLGKNKPLNQVKGSRIVKPVHKITAKAKPKPTTTLFTAFNHDTKTTIGKGPLSPSSPTLHRTQSISSNPSVAQKSRSTTASLSSLPTPISGIISQHTNSFSPSAVAAPQEEDIEKPKPRCQRCRKSKKGCDRQRPCQRCKDAGIGIDGCISEDESGTRRGRAGAAKKIGAVAGAGGMKKAVKPKKKIATKH